MSEKELAVIEYNSISEKITKLEEQIVREKNARVSKQAKERNVEQLQNRIIGLSLKRELLRKELE